MITDGCVQFQVEIKQVEVCLFAAILISVIRSMDVVGQNNVLLYSRTVYIYSM